MITIASLFVKIDRATVIALQLTEKNTQMCPFRACSACIIHQIYLFQLYVCVVMYEAFTVKMSCCIWLILHVEIVHVLAVKCAYFYNCQHEFAGGELVRVSSWGDWEVVHCSSQYKQETGKQYKHGTSSQVKIIDPATSRVPTKGRYDQNYLPSRGLRVTSNNSHCGYWSWFILDAYFFYYYYAVIVRLFLLSCLVLHVLVLHVWFCSSDLFQCSSMYLGSRT